VKIDLEINESGRHKNCCPLGFGQSKKKKKTPHFPQSFRNFQVAPTLAPWLLGSSGSSLNHFSSIITTGFPSSLSMFLQLATNLHIYLLDDGWMDGWMDSWGLCNCYNYHPWRRETMRSCGADCWNRMRARAAVRLRFCRRRCSGRKLIFRCGAVSRHWFFSRMNSGFTRVDLSSCKLISSPGIWDNSWSSCSGIKL